jgi:F420-dependent oxidoreductase-like protein
MRISVSVTDYSWHGGAPEFASRFARVARAADDAGLDTLWVADHLIQADPTSTPEGEMLEAYTTLGYLAAATSRIRLGTMVTAASYRPATLLIKAVTTLDVLSGGRAWLGIGAGYQEDETKAMGLPMPPVVERFERLEETLRLARQMWAGDPSPFAGAHLRPERPLSFPPPLSRPHPPILIGGMGEKKTLRLVAEHADACNLFDVPDRGETIARKLTVLARHCATIGRDFDSIEKTVSTRLEPAQSPEAFAARCEALSTLGIDHAVVITSGPWTDDAIATLAEAHTGGGG